MDEISDFFDFSNDFKTKLVPGERASYTAGALGGISQSTKRRENEYKDYFTEVLENGRIKLDHLHLSALVGDSHEDEGCGAAAASSCVDVDVDVNVEKDLPKDANDCTPKAHGSRDSIYDRYTFDMNRDKSLPIYEKRNEIVNMVQKYPVTILEGDNGCGKTTQVAQYILDNACERREYCKVICTQPGRVAAKSLAQRVCQERKWQVGTIVGYQVAFDAKLSDDTRLLYCTHGILLQKFIYSKNLDDYTHIILDDVHVRDKEMDFVLLVIRRLLTTTSKCPKILVMSATINTLEFSEYFKIEQELPPVISVKSQSAFNVKEHYLCDLIQMLTKTRGHTLFPSSPTTSLQDLNFDYANPGVTKEMFDLALKIVVFIDNIDIEEAELSLDASSDTTSTNSVLIFLPGVHEIEEMCKGIAQLNNSKKNSLRLRTIRLHSLVPCDEQVRIFQPVPPGYRKVILATNIAENSITVPDVKYVIDFCLTKAAVTDTASTYSFLQLEWASKTKCKQRSGRVGRVMNGHVYRLIPRYIYEDIFEEFSTPEMLRCSLEDIILRAKVLDMGPPTEILGLAMSPPNVIDIHNTVLTLKELGALHTNVNGKYCLQDGDITYMGRIMAALPLDIRYSRLIVLGHIFSILEEAIIIAAGLSVPSIFKLSDEIPRADCKEYIQKLEWADGSGSDLFAILNAYKAWQQNKFRKDVDEYAWASRLGIKVTAIKEMHLMLKEIKDRLSNFNITQKENCYQRVNWTDSEKSLIIKIIIAGGFYPNYFTRNHINDMEKERSMYDLLHGNDPCSTVYLINLNDKLIGEIYTSYIKDIFRDVSISPENIDVQFPPDSEKIFITFKSDDTCNEAQNPSLVLGRVRSELYKALRMRISKMQPSLNVMDISSSIRYAEEHGYGDVVQGVWQPRKMENKYADLSVLPSKFKKKIRGQITHVENCGKFYFLPVEQNTTLHYINETLSNPRDLSANKFHNPEQILKGMVLVAALDGIYQRAKVIKMHKFLNYYQFKLLFIDNGCTGLVAFDELHALPSHLSPLGDIPPRIFECRLAMVQPSSVLSPDGKWLKCTKDLLQELADAGEIEIHIFSVVEWVSNVIIHLDNNTTFNAQLVKSLYAQKSEETYMSKIDHDMRERSADFDKNITLEDCIRQNTEYLQSRQRTLGIPEPPPRENCKKVIRLNGPFSPLETEIFSALQKNSRKTVQVVKESVNSVLLNTDPQNMHSTFIVAAGVSKTLSGDNMVLRNTTVMPHIHGFSALMAMLFCPTMQIKRNKSCSKFVAVLAGLGYCQDTYMPLNAAHDLLVNFDVEIDTEDLDMINQLRYFMSRILFSHSGDGRPYVNPMQLGDLQFKIKETIMRLMRKNRKFIEMRNDASDNFWECHEDSEILEVKYALNYRSVFPFLSSLRLHDENSNQTQALLVHCEELYKLRDMDGNIRPIVCQLCNQYLKHVYQIRMHLLSQLHLDREQQIGFKPKKREF